MISEQCKESKGYILDTTSQLTAPLSSQYMAQLLARRAAMVKEALVGDTQVSAIQVQTVGGRRKGLSSCSSCISFLLQIPVRKTDPALMVSPFCWAPGTAQGSRWLLCHLPTLLLGTLAKLPEMVFEEVLQTPPG